MLSGPLVVSGRFQPPSAPSLVYALAAQNNNQAKSFIVVFQLAGVKVSF